MNDELSILNVTERAFGEVGPTAAVLHVVLASDRFFSGRAPLEKAEELRRLVVALVSKGIPDDAVTLEGASLDVSSGVFSKSSSVTYRLRVDVREIDLLPDALDAIAESKKATLTNVTWDYAGAPADAKLLADCAGRAIAKAEALAAALGVAIEAVHTVREDEIDTAPPFLAQQPAALGAPMAMRTRASIAAEMRGLDLAPKKTIGVAVHLACRIKACG